MSKTKENIIKRIALVICDTASMLTMFYMAYLIGNGEVISLNNFLLLMGGLLWFIFYVLGIAELLIKGKDSLIAKSFKQAFDLVFNKLFKTDIKLD